MRNWIGRSIQLFMAIVLCIPFGASQTRRPGTKSKPAPSAPFLLQAKSYEETTYVTRVKFKNGMTVIVQEVRSLPLLSIQTYVDTGDSLQIAHNPELANILASMVCRGGIPGSTGTFRQRVQLLGGFFKHSTKFRNTLFEIVVPSAQWKQALALQEEVLFHPSFESNAIQIENRLAKEEAHRILADPVEFSRERLRELVFDKNQMTKYQIPQEDSLSNIAPETLAGLHKSLYIPSGMTLVVCGDIRSSDILNEISRLYDQSIRDQTKSDSQQSVSRQKGFQYRALHGSVTVPRILFGFRAVAEKEDDYRTLEVLSAILGLGEGSILPARLGDQKHLVYSAETRLESYPGFGYLAMEMTADSRNIDKSEIAAITEIELLKRKEPNAFEMERAFRQLEHAYWKKIETVSGKAEVLAHFEFLGDWKRKDRYIEEIRKVKASDVRRVAQRYLQLQNCSLLEYLPNALAERNLAPEDVLRTLEGLLEVSANQEQEARAKEVVYVPKEAAEKRLFQYSEIRYPFQKASILRGPDMYIREDHTSPLIDLGMFFPGGKQFENIGNSGITELMIHLMLHGSKDKQELPFLSQMEALGGKVQPVIGDDYFGFYFSIFADNFGPGFNLLQGALKNPVFSKEEIVRQKELQRIRIVQWRASSQFLPKLVDQELFRESSYALDAAGTEASISGITPELLQNWYASYVHNKKPIIVAIGDAKGTSLASYFVQHFSGSRMQNAESLKVFAKPLEKGSSLERNRYGRESIIFIGFQAPPIEDEDCQIVKVIEGHLGFQGRLTQRLRDQLGIAHAVALIYEPRLRGGSIIASAFVRPENEEAALKHFKEEIQRVSEAPMDSHDFRAAQNSAIGQFEIQNQIRANQISDLTRNLLADRGISDYSNFVKEILEIPEEDLKAVAKRIFNMDKSVIVRVHANSQ